MYESVKKYAELLKNELSILEKQIKADEKMMEKNVQKFKELKQVIAKLEAE